MHKQSSELKSQSSTSAPPTIEEPVVPPSSRKAALQENRTSLVGAYRRWFDVVQATSDELRKEAYRLRYQVYCVENAFEDPAQNPGEMETDEFDAVSAHSLLVHRATDATAGTVRLVLPTTCMGAVRLVLPNSDGPGRELPIYRVCPRDLFSGTEICPPDTTAEISRFAISKQFRRRREDGRYPSLPTAEERMKARMEERRLIPHITLGLMNAIVRMSVENGITHWYAIMEPALLRLLSRLGIHFKPLGPMIEHHGRRQPVYADAGELLAGIWEERPEVWEVITDSGITWPLSKRFTPS